MIESFATTIAKESLFLVLILSLPPVVGAMVVGLMVSLIQATTQVQEQTLTFVPKMVAVVLILVFLGPLGMVHVISFTKTLLMTFPQVIQ